MDFANAIKEEGKFIRTENGAVALNTTSDARLDLFGTIGALRDADENRITTLFSEAYAQDKLFATKIIFYARDIRCGLGERKTFRTIIRYMAEHHPESLTLMRAKQFLCLLNGLKLLMQVAQRLEN